MKNYYKFRAECLEDVIELLSNRGTMLQFVSIIRTDLKLPDVEVEIVTNLPIEVVVRIIDSSVVDGHVMSDTIAPKHLYSGDRNTRDERERFGNENRVVNYRARKQ